MKAVKIILSAIIVLVSTINISARNVVSVDSTHLLNKEQKKTIKYARDMMKSQKNTILLPIEYNNLIGDSVSKAQIELETNWGEAFFVEKEDKCANLLVPLKSGNAEIQPVLNVFRDEKGKYYRMVITYRQTQSDTIKEEIIMKSNIEGVFINALVFQNEQLVAQINGVFGDYGVVDGPEQLLIRSRIYDRFCTTGYPYVMSFADSYEYLMFSTDPVKNWGRVKKPY